MLKPTNQKLRKSVINSINYYIKLNLIRGVIPHYAWKQIYTCY